MNFPNHTTKKGTQVSNPRQHTATESPKIRLLATLRAFLRWNGISAPTNLRGRGRHLRGRLAFIFVIAVGLLSLFAAPAGAKEATFSLAFGSKGSEGGQFGTRGPGGSGIDSEGNVWVADPSNDRLERFNSKGEYLSQVALGESPNEVFVSTALANGSLISTPTAVQYYNPTTGKLTSFGSGEGSGNGQFLGAAGVAFDAGFNIWAVDKGNDRVEKFGAKHEYLSQFGSKGSGNGQFLSPQGLAIGAGGNLWVVDTGNDRVEEFNKEGKYLTQFGTKGSGAGQFVEPQSIVIDSTGDIWITDRGNDRIEKFNSEGKYLSQFGTKGSGNGQFSAPGGLSMDGSNNLFVSDAGNFRVQKLLSVAATFSLAFGSKGSEPGQFGALGPGGNALGSESDVWVTDPSNTRMEQFNLKGEFLSQFATGEAPNDVATWLADYTFVSGPNSVRLYSPTGSLKEPTYGSAGSGNGQFEGASGVALENLLDLWVVDTGNNRVEKFEVGSAKYLSQFGTKGSGNGQFLSPQGLAIDAAGDLWVVDTGNDRVEEFNKEGKYLTQFGSKGSGAGQFVEPRGIAIDSAGNIWVTDRGTNRVEKFDSGGKYLSQFGTKGSGSGQFNAPGGLSIDGSNNLLVSDAGNFRVQKWGTSE